MAKAPAGRSHMGGWTTQRFQNLAGREAARRGGLFANADGEIAAAAGQQTRRRVEFSLGEQSFE